jgi:hypothetical protein
VRFKACGMAGLFLMILHENREVKKKKKKKKKNKNKNFQLKQGIVENQEAPMSEPKKEFNARQCRRRP